MKTVLIMLDGVRPDALGSAATPNLNAFRATAAHSMRAQTVWPSITLPCHMSLFHSVPPDRHGTRLNSFVPQARPVQGLVDVAAAAGKRCAFFYNWEPLRDLARPEALHASFFRAGAVNPEMDDFVCEDALRYIAHAQARPQDALDFAFVYFGTVDEEGHRSGWMSDGYMRQLARVDGLVGRLLAALPADAAVLIQSDHGGHDRTHGTLEPEDMTIPWMLRAPGVTAGDIAAPVSILDSAPTLARLMGLTTPAAWEGRAVGVG